MKRALYPFLIHTTLFSLSEGIKWNGHYREALFPPPTKCAVSSNHHKHIPLNIRGGDINGSSSSQAETRATGSFWKKKVKRGRKEDEISKKPLDETSALTMEDTKTPAVSATQRSTTTPAPIIKSPPPPGFPLVNYNDRTNSEKTSPPLLSIPLIINSMKNHFTFDRVWTMTQYGVGIWLFMAIWKEVREAWDEIVEEAEEKSRGGGLGGGSAGIKEEHDLPFISAESVDLILMEENEKKKQDLYEQQQQQEEQQQKEDLQGQSYADSPLLDSQQSNKKIEAENRKSYYSNNSSNEGKQNPTKTSRKNISMNKRIRRDASHARDLALRLHASGLPLESDNPKDSTLTVEKVLKSLTRTEGQLLANSLLSPPMSSNSPLSNEMDSLQQHHHQQINVEAWDEIGGLTHVKEALLDLMYPFTHHANSPPDVNTMNQKQQSYLNYGGLLNHPPGLLLYGPPGCGKTMLARALAHSTNARFLSITPSTLLRKYVGETNLNVRALFSLARKIQPCIIFVDEMDGLFRERGGGGSGGEEHDVSRDLKTEFMSLWDGIASNSNGSTSSFPQPNDLCRKNGVIVVGATNRPFDVDSAFLRRMPRSFFVGLPDYASRCAILTSMLKNVPLEASFDIDMVARESEGYSGSDIQELLRTAALFPLREARKAFMEQQQWGHSNDNEMPPLRPLTTEDVLRAKERVSPTQFSPGYRAALTDYTSRANSGNGMRNDDLNYVMNEPSGYDYNGNQYYHENQGPNPYDNEYPKDNEDLESEMSDSSSSSMNDDDDYF